MFQAIRFASQLALAALASNATAALAVIFVSTGDPNHNTEAPVGELTGSGWDLQGDWSWFLGTPIGPKHFITAKHLGGAVGDKLHLNGIAYTTSAYFDDPNSDLRIWKIRETFPRYAGIYPRPDEVGQDIMIFGRGTQRGEAVAVNSLLGSATKGWLWGLADGRKRWGRNRVSNVVSDGRYPAARDGVLRATFDADAGPDEAHISAGDSGGAIFIQDGPDWKIAGINYTVDGPYNTSDTGDGIFAAIFDEGGLYKGGAGNWTRVPDSFSDIPGGFYATRISVRLDWIQGILAQTSDTDAPILESASAVHGPYSTDSSAVIDPQNRVITLTPSVGPRFYRLNNSTALRITEIKLQEGALVLRYE